MTHSALPFLAMPLVYALVHQRTWHTGQARCCLAYGISRLVMACECGAKHRLGLGPEARQVVGAGRGGMIGSLIGVYAWRVGSKGRGLWAEGEKGREGGDEGDGRRKCILNFESYISNLCMN
ncbi:hypothetical protein EJ04DRAFT_50554 [Polyplosphaeria fusca]|uniref:Uncharacterized protein n=1 Tax=Polyplosphaeria fusca TaxID=682080 RepID=A0A9P4QSM0_9PLEO|nr:hypothetical protein EJ04DRAFT_50554 [Polyplosphaeria fusca]